MTETKESIFTRLHELSIKELQFYESIIEEAKQAGEKEFEGLSISYAAYEIDQELRSREAKELVDPKIHFSLDELLNMNFPESVFYVDRILTTGLTLLWGAAKTGKSILILHILLAISQGGRALGSLNCHKAAVLLISLEDGPRRLQKRLQTARAVPDTENFYISTDWPRGQKGIDRLKQYLDEHPDIKVVVIDTLFLLTKIQDGNDYSQTVSIMETLKRIADDRDIAIIAIHHSRKVGKGTSGDIIETALGSTGIVAGPDHLLYLKRTPSGPADAVLHFVSKDAEPAEIALRFDKDIMGWCYQGEVCDLADTDERQEILDLLRKEAQPMTTGNIAEGLGKKTQAISNLLTRMLQKEQIQKIRYGLYSIPSKTQCNPCKCESLEAMPEEGYTDTLHTPVTGVEIEDESSENIDNQIDLLDII